VTFFFLASQPPSFLACKPIADAFADPRTDFGQFSGPENKHHNRQDDQKLHVPESEYVASCFLSIKKGPPAGRPFLRVNG
jgi:hypothetical protein